MIALATSQEETHISHTTLSAYMSNGIKVSKGAKIHILSGV